MTDSIAFSGRRFNRRPTSPAASSFNPATLPLTGWWRAPYATVSWLGTPSSGFSSGSNLIQTASLNQPTAVASTLNGATIADFDGSNDWLTLAQGANVVQPLSLLFSASAGSVACLYNAETAGADVAAGAPFSMATFVSDLSPALFGFGVSSTGVRGGYYDGLTWDSANVATSLNVWHLAQMRWDGTKVEVRVDGGSWATTARAGGIQNLAGIVRVGVAYDNGRLLDGQIAELLTAASVFTDAQFDAFRSYCNTRYRLNV